MWLECSESAWEPRIVVYKSDQWQRVCLRAENRGRQKRSMTASLLESWDVSVEYKCNQSIKPARGIGLQCDCWDWINLASWNWSRGLNCRRIASMAASYLFWHAKALHHGCSDACRLLEVAGSTCNERATVWTHSCTNKGHSYYRSVPNTCATATASILFTCTAF